MAATGFAWFAANFTTSGMAAIDWLSEQALYLHRGPLIQLVLSYPSGRLAGRLDRVVVAIAYVAAVIPAVWGSGAATFALAGLIVLAAARATSVRRAANGGCAWPPFRPRPSSPRSSPARRRCGSPSRPRR